VHLFINLGSRICNVGIEQYVSCCIGSLTDAVVLSGFEALDPFLNSFKNDMFWLWRGLQ
jgi:hypothetical protein